MLVDFHTAGDERLRGELHQSLFIRHVLNICAGDILGDKKAINLIVRIHGL